MHSRRRATTPLDALLARRGKALRDRVEPEVTATLAALRQHGVVVEVVGSFARGQIRSTSDVDFLVSDLGNLDKSRAHRLVSDVLRSAPYDIIFESELPAGSAELMRAHAIS